MGLALAMIINARGSTLRGPALVVFAVQMAANLVWSPVFFGMHQVVPALAILGALLVLALITFILFARIRTFAAVLLIPYLAWIAFAGVLLYQIHELNPNAANALLKILEEPPQQSLFLLVSHAPARVLPTILSRCRKLLLRPLASEDVARAAAAAANVAADDPALREAAAASDGSVARALTLLGGDALKLQQRTAALLARLPQVDPRELHALGEQLPLSDRVALAAFVDGVERWISERLHADADANANLPRLARLAEVWEKVARTARDTADYNLERKPFVFSVFSQLAEATR